MIEKYAVAKEDEFEVKAEELVKTGEYANISDARSAVKLSNGDKGESPSNKNIH